MPSVSPVAQASEPLRRRKKVISGVSREDSDDELGSDDLPWELIYNAAEPERSDAEGDRKRRKVTGKNIVGARLGNFECRVGDCVLLKAEGSNEAWVAIICEFLEDEEDGEKTANFMWFSTEREVRNKERKRGDSYWVGHVRCRPSSAVLILN